MSVSVVENRDCMEAMKNFPTGFFDLAVVDPPYGGGGLLTSSQNREAVSEGGLAAARISASRTGGTWSKKYRAQNGGIFSGGGKSELGAHFVPRGRGKKYSDIKQNKDIMHWKVGDKILDTHLGSGSSRIAAYAAGLDFWGYEIDKFYFDEANKRFGEYTRQMSIFDVAGGEQLTIGDFT